MKELSNSEIHDLELEQYWEKIPIWGSNGKMFETVIDGFSGAIPVTRIPVTRVEHWRDFATLLESDFFNKPTTQLLYRGHRRFDWSMTPTLGRLTDNGIVTQELADKQLTLFRQAVRGRINDNALLESEDQSDELWAIGQHYGLMTPLLDWTYSPYVALFFAFSKEDKEDEKDNPYRAIYIINKSFLERQEVQDEIRLFEPKKDNHGRLVSQAGLFTFSPTDATIENKIADILASEEFQEELAYSDTEEEANLLAQYICKVYIKNEDQQECLKHLRRMNVHHASLFPDLQGASDYCNIMVAEQEKEEQLKVEQDIKEAANVIGDIVVKSIKLSSSDEEIIDAEEIQSIEELLTAPESSKEVEPARLSLIAKQLDKLIRENAVVDWDAREAIQARIRNGARIILRKNAYPQGARDAVVNQIIDVVTSKSESKTLDLKNGDKVKVKGKKGEFLFIEIADADRLNGVSVIGKQGDAMLRNSLSGSTVYFPLSDISPISSN